MAKIVNEGVASQKLKQGGNFLCVSEGGFTLQPAPSLVVNFGGYTSPHYCMYVINLTFITVGLIMSIRASSKRVTQVVIW